MPSIKKCKIKELSEAPLFLTRNDVAEYFGFGKEVVNMWFKTPNFPMITDGAEKIIKYDLVQWLCDRYGLLFSKNMPEMVFIDAIKKAVEEQEKIEAFDSIQQNAPT